MRTAKIIIYEYTYKEKKGDKEFKEAMTVHIAHPSNITIFLYGECGDTFFTRDLQEWESMTKTKVKFKRKIKKERII